MLAFRWLYSIEKQSVTNAVSVNSLRFAQIYFFAMCLFYVVSDIYLPTDADTRLWAPPVFGAVERGRFLIFFVRGSLLTNLPARVASYSRTSVIVRLCGYGYRCLHRCRSLYVTAYIRICRQKYVNPQRRMNRRRYVNTQVRIRVSERVKY